MAHWMWYPGDFELYHSLLQNFDREERGFFWPANWKAAQYHHCVHFSLDYELEKETKIRIWAKGRGYLNLRRAAQAPPWIPKERLTGGVFYAEQKFPLDGLVRCPAGKGGLDIILCDPAGLPCVLVESENSLLDSGKGWLVSDQVMPPVKVGWNCLYTKAEQNPRVFEYTSQVLNPVSIENVNGGLLLDYGRELTAQTLVEFPIMDGNLTLCYGESRQEALDVQMCYLKNRIAIRKEKEAERASARSLPTGTQEELLGQFQEDGIEFASGEDVLGSMDYPAKAHSWGRYRTRLRAFRYLFLPEKEIAEKCHILADYQYVAFPERASFICSDERLNQIWKVANITFRLASGLFFLDGIKRDRYIWSGDAYQSYFINQYLFFDEEICKRTMLALRGSDPIVQHLNRIPDYSMYWLIGMENFYQMTGDAEFLEMVYPKMKSMMDYLENQLEEHGFLYGRPDDWIYIDWADLDKDGPISAEQFLLARSYQTMAKVCGVLGGLAAGQNQNGCQNWQKQQEIYSQKERNLLIQIREMYWDNEQGAFIDSFTSGRRKVSRHPNIFALLFDYTTKEETESILTHVLYNDQVSAITTPYFKFYELEALAKLGDLDCVMGSIRSYWGGMLDRGANTFWEEYKPDEPEEGQYGMYGDPYGKSLCHAWGASPIYLLGRYVCGLRPTTPGYESWELAPYLDTAKDSLITIADLSEIHARLPLKNGSVKLDYEDGRIAVETDRDGGTLVWKGERHTLVAGKRLEL